MPFFKRKEKTAGEKRAFTNDPYIYTVPNLDSTVFTDNSYVGIGALKNSNIFTAVSLIATPLASIPIRIKKNGQVIQDKQLHKVLNVKPNEIMSAYSFRWAIVANMLLNGESFALIERDEVGQLSALRIIPCSDIQVYSDERTIRYEYTQHTYDKNGVEKGQKRFMLDSEEILHFKVNAVDGLRGVSPIYSLSSELTMMEKTNNTLLSYMKRGIQGSSVLSLSNAQLNKETKDKIRRDFEEANANNQVIILDKGMEWKQVEVNANALQLANSNDWTTKQVAKAFGIPLDRFGMEMVNTSTAESNKNFIQSTLNGHFQAITSELDIKLGEIISEMDVIETYFDTKSLTFDSEKQVERLISEVAGSIKTPNEVRKELDLPPVEGGDVIKELNPKNPQPLPSEGV